MPLLGGLIFLLALISVHGAALSWTSGGGTALWFDSNNWNTSTVPGPDDDVFIGLLDVPCSVVKATGQTAIKSLWVGSSCSLRLSSLLNVTGPTKARLNTVQVGGILVLVDSAHLATPSGGVHHLFVRNSAFSGTLEIYELLAFLPSTNACDSSTFTVHGDLLFGGATLRLTFGDAFTKDYCRLEVSGSLIFGTGGTVKLVTRSLGSWQSYAYTDLQPVVAASIHGTYTVITEDVCFCTTFVANSINCGEGFYAYCPSNVRKKKHAQSPTEKRQAVAQCSSPETEGYKAPTPGQGCIGSGFGVLLGTTECDTTETVTPTCPPYLIGPSCSTAFCSPYTTVVDNCNQHGTCAAAAGSSACTCEPGWSSNDCSIPLCSSACLHGNCTAPDTCSCDIGWSGTDCSTPVCSPACGTNGFCDSRVNPHVCVCNATWTNPPACDTKATQCPTSSVTGQTCGGVAKGTCDSDSLLCLCATDWSGVSCDVPMCNGVDVNICSGHGNCDASVSPHRCNCSTGWNGTNCQTPSCHQDCSGNGLCTASGQIPVCSCFAGFQPPYCSSAYLIPTNVTVPPATTADPSVTSQTSTTPSSSSGTSSTPSLTLSSAATVAASKKKRGVSPMVIGITLGAAFLLIIVLGVLVYIFHGRLITLFKSDNDSASSSSASSNTKKIYVTKKKSLHNNDL